MNTENTVYDENTTYNGSTSNNGQYSGNNEAEPQPKGGRPMWVSVAGSAGAGLLVGAASSFFATRMYAATTDEDPTPDDPVDNNGGQGNGQQTVSFVGGEVQMATSVNDDMSFNEAFAAARTEVGAGGVFEWHGNIYGTYYKDEWDNMTAEQRDAFGQSVGGYSASTADAGHDTMAQHQESQSTTTTTTTAETEHVPDDDVAVVGTDEPYEPDVQVLGMVYDDESGANIGAMSVDGQEVYLIDVDPDGPGMGEFDFIAADLNNDGQISDDEIVDIQDQHIDVAQFGGMSNPVDPMVDGGQGDLYAQNGNLPDYVNDADMGDYVG